MTSSSEDNAAASRRALRDAAMNATRLDDKCDAPWTELEVIQKIVVGR
jgi:hypothetical protein